MWRSIQLRVGLIVLFLALSIFFLIPTLVDPLPKWWTKYLPTEKINLGLDLRGGMHLLLEVEVQKAVESALDKYASDIKDTLTQEGHSPHQDRANAGRENLRHAAGQQGQRPLQPNPVGSVRQS